MRPARIASCRCGPATRSTARARMEVDEDPRGLFVLLNGLDRGRELQPGDRVKIVRRADRVRRRWRLARRA